MALKDDIQSRVNAGETVRSGALAQEAGVARSTVSKTLTSLSREGQIEKIGHGVYRKAQQQERRPARAQESHRMQVLKSIVRARGEIGNGLGLQYDEKRNLFETLGYKKELGFHDYWNRYERGDIAKRIVDAPVKATWRNPPRVFDDEQEDGTFARAWNALVQEHFLYKEFQRADIRARIGDFGLLFLGFPGELRSAPNAGNPLRFVASFRRGDIGIRNFESNPRNERFGRVNAYRIDFTNSEMREAASIRDREVHWRRTIHIAEDAIVDDIHGTPALRAVYNRLADLDKVIGGAAESVWRTFDRGLVFKQDPDAILDDDTRDNLEDEIEAYLHDYKRFMQLVGVDVESLGSEAADPRGHFQVLASVIAGTTGIPQRILFGSERGQLASQQDERSWNAQIKERQRTFAEPNILRPFIQRMVDLRVLPAPQGLVRVEWPDLSELSLAEKLQNFKTMAQAVRNLVDRESGVNELVTREERRRLIQQFAEVELDHPGENEDNS